MTRLIAGSTLGRMPRVLSLAACAILAVWGAISAVAYTIDHRYADPGWDGYTYEHFDYLMGWDSGNYWGQTSVWTNDTMTYLVSRNQLYETCDFFGELDGDTGNVWAYNTTQPWGEADGGYADDFWDCITFQSIESHAYGTYHNNSPAVVNDVTNLIIYHQFRP